MVPRMVVNVHVSEVAASMKVVIFWLRRSKRGSRDRNRVSFMEIEAMLQSVISCR